MSSLFLWQAPEQDEVLQSIDRAIEGIHNVALKNGGKYNLEQRDVLQWVHKTNLKLLHSFLNRYIVPLPFCPPLKEVDPSQKGDPRTTKLLILRSQTRPPIFQQWNISQSDSSSTQWPSQRLRTTGGHATVRKHGQYAGRAGLLSGNTLM